MSKEQPHPFLRAFVAAVILIGLLAAANLTISRAWGIDQAWLWAWVAFCFLTDSLYGAEKRKGA